MELIFLQTSISRVESLLCPLFTHVKEMLLFCLFSNFSIFENILLSEKLESLTTNLLYTKAWKLGNGCSISEEFAFCRQRNYTNFVQILPWPVEM